jgi:hypothetical protein
MLMPSQPATKTSLATSHLPMRCAAKSLHRVVDKWLALSPVIPVRVTQVRRIGTAPCRCVRVEATRPGGPLLIFFFRHDDGTWNVFPPAVERPAMNGYRKAA